MTKHHEENQAETRKPDGQGRIVIGKQYSKETFSIEPQSNGDILLRPVVIIPKNEAWLFSNAEALDSVKRGLSELAKGELVSKGTIVEADDGDAED